MSSLQLPAVLPFQPVRMSVERYHQLVRLGAFNEHDRVELLDGVVSEQISKNPPHGMATRKCDLRLSAFVPAGWHVRNQEPITLETSEPEPDVAVVQGDLYRQTTVYRRGDQIPIVIQASPVNLVSVDDLLP